MYKIRYVEIVNCIGKFVATLLIENEVCCYILGGVEDGNDRDISFCRALDGIVEADTTTCTGGSNEFGAVLLSRKLEYKVGVTGNGILGDTNLDVLLHENVDASYANGCKSLSLKCKI